MRSVILAQSNFTVGPGVAQLRAAEREIEHMNKISGWRVCLLIACLAGMFVYFD